MSKRLKNMVAKMATIFLLWNRFVDGNKRVGIGSAIVFLVINGYEDNLDDDEGYRKTLEIAGCNIEERMKVESSSFRKKEGK